MNPGREGSEWERISCPDVFFGLVLSREVRLLTYMRDKTPSYLRPSPLYFYLCEFMCQIASVRARVQARPFLAHVFRF